MLQAQHCPLLHHSIWPWAVQLCVVPSPMSWKCVWIFLVLPASLFSSLFRVQLSLGCAASSCWRCCKLSLWSEAAGILLCKRFPCMCVTLTFPFSCCFAKTLPCLRKSFASTLKPLVLISSVLHNLGTQLENHVDSDCSQDAWGELCGRVRTCNKADVGVIAQLVFSQGSVVGPKSTSLNFRKTFVHIKSLSGFSTGSEFTLNQRFNFFHMSADLLARSCTFVRKIHCKNQCVNY